MRDALGIFGAVLLLTACTPSIVSQTTLGLEATTTTIADATDTTEAVEVIDQLVLGLPPGLDAEQTAEARQNLQESLSDELSIAVTTFSPVDHAALVEALGTGEVDIAFLGPLSVVVTEERFQAEPILISTRFGASVYYGQWFLSDDDVCEETPVADEEGRLSCVAPLSIVDGARVAFTEKTSVAGYLLPAYQLIGAGIDPQTDIFPVFLGGHDVSVLAVYADQTEFGVSLKDARVLVTADAEDVGEEVIVFHQTPPIPNDAMVVRSGLPEDLKQKIQTSLLRFAGSEDGAETLETLFEIDGFVVVPFRAYDEIRNAYKALKDQL